MKKTEWVSITEQHPEYGKDVLLLDDWGNGATQEMKVGYLIATVSRQTADGIAVSCEWRGHDVINITHWMDLPLPPPKNNTNKPIHII